MAVGMTPLIPLYRVQSDPDARFQRFGMNESQLIGKPMVNLGPESLPSQPQRTALRTATTHTQPQEEVLEGNRGVRAGRTQPFGSAVAESASGYSRWAGNPLGTWTSTKLGSYLELKA